ncbi:MAG TPA: hypothetical protein VGI43_08130 [Mucilaginibacter sp.]|jgi:hypothetical protein
MNLRTFWTIFLKIFGLYLIWQILSILSTDFSIIYIFNGLNKILYKDHDKVFFYITLSGMVFMVLLLIWTIRYCIFKTDSIIEKLRLEKGFSEEKVEINIYPLSLLTIAVIALGGFILSDSLPRLVADIIMYAGLRQNKELGPVISNLLRAFLGYFMVTKSSLIVNFIERNRKGGFAKNEDTVE